MTAQEARDLAKKNTGRQLPVDSYLKWINKRIENRCSSGKNKVEPVFDGMDNDVVPNKESCEAIAEKLKADGFEVAFNENDLIVRVSW